MRILLQRVIEASVEVDGEIISKIGRGLLIFLGVTEGDSEKDAQTFVEKISNLRIFPKEDKEFDQSIIDIKGEILIVSQFTLYGSCDKGRRPDFNQAAKGPVAEPIYEKFVDFFSKTGLKVEKGRFGAFMKIGLINDGPATFIL